MCNVKLSFNGSEVRCCLDDDDHGSHHVFFTRFKLEVARDETYRYMRSAMLTMLMDYEDIGPISKELLTSPKIELTHPPASFDDLKPW